MGRKKHLILREKKKAIDGLIEEKPLRMIANEIERSKGAVENVKRNYPEEIKTNKDKLLSEIGLTPNYIIQKIKDDIESMPTDKYGNVRREKLLELSCKINGLLEVEKNQEETTHPIVVDKQINIILEDAENRIREHLLENIKSGNIE